MFTRNRTVAVAVAVLGLASPPLVHGQITCEIDRLVASDEDQGGGLGRSFAVEGDTIVAGGKRIEGSAPHPTFAVVYTRQGTEWVEAARITATETEPGDAFGEALALAGDRLIVGASARDDVCPQDPDCNSGAAYVFRREGAAWVEEAKLLPADIEATDFFGNAVDIDGDFAVVGARSAADFGDGSGAAYVFERIGSNWVERAKLLASDGHGLARFGISVAINGTDVVVGSYFHNSAGSHSGAAYIYRRSGASWPQVQKLVPADAASRDFFGVSVQISGDFLVVGAQGADGAEVSMGAAYVYRRDGLAWVPDAKLTAGDPASNALFGSSVSIFGDDIVVGARSDNELGTRAGAAYWFEREGGGWVEQAKLPALQVDAEDRLGTVVATDGEIALAGYPWCCPWAYPPGRVVHLFAVGEADCNDNGIADPCESDADVDGVIDDCDNCASDFNDDQADQDQDGAGDVCDPCPAEAPDDQDGDGVCYPADECPTDPLKTGPGQCGCGVADTDSDGDAIADCIDQCPGVDDAVFGPTCAGAIPTVSEWGLVAMALLLLTAGKIYYSRRKTTTG